MRKVIVNSTPMIILSKLGLLDLLQTMYGEIVIPDAVYREISRKNDAIKHAIEEESMTHEQRVFFSTIVTEGRKIVLNMAWTASE